MTRLGRTKIAAVRALSTATRELAICAPGPVEDVEGADVVRSARLERPRLVVGAAVADVENRLVGREREAVRLVERVVDNAEAAAVEAVDVVAVRRLGLEALQEPVARI